MTGFVYLVWAKGTDKYKIGSSGYPERRIKELQVGSPIKLEFVVCKESESYEAEERTLHRKWKNCNSHGEWFTFHPLQMPEVLSGFGFQDRWTAKRIEDLDNKAAQVIQDYADKIQDKTLKFKETCLENLRNNREDNLSIVEAKAYSSTLFLLFLLNNYLGKNLALRIVDEFNSFNNETEVVSLSILQKSA
jgi:hypothetical protein